MSRRHRGQRIYNVAQERNNLRVGLIGHWTGGGSGNTWLDTVRGNDMVMVGTPLWTLGYNYKRPAIFLNGSDAYVSAGDVQAVDDIGTGSFSFSFWANPDSVSGTGVFLSKGGYSTNTGVIIFYSSSVLYFKIYSGGLYQITTTAITGWHHWAFVRNGGTLYIYKDGVEVSSGAKTAVNISNSSSLAIGQVTGGSSSTLYGGKIDDVRIYNRALSPAEIYQLYQDNNISNTTLRQIVDPSTVEETPIYGKGILRRHRGQRVYSIAQERNNLRQGLKAHYVFGSGWSYRDTARSRTAGLIKNANRLTVGHGEKRTALEFDGSNTWVDLGSGVLLSSSGDWTISTWVKPDATSDKVIFAQYTAVSGNGRFLLRISDAPSNVFEMFLGNIGALGSERVQSTTTITTGRWYHVVAKRTGDDFTLYINGIREATLNSPSRAIQQIGNLVGVRDNNGGAYNSGVAGFFDGTIDDIHIYERALSSAEVSQLYQDNNVISTNSRTVLDTSSFPTVISGRGSKRHRGQRVYNISQERNNLRIGLVGQWNPQGGGSILDTSGGTMNTTTTDATWSRSYTKDKPLVSFLSAGGVARTAYPRQLPSTWQGIGNNDSYTITAWFTAPSRVSPGTAGTSYPAKIIAALRVDGIYASYGQPFHVGLSWPSNYNGKLGFGRRGSGGGEYAGYANTTCDDGKLHLGVWVVKDDELTMYLDGKLDATKTITSATGNCSLSTNNVHFSIGNRITNTDLVDDNNRWEGEIGEVRVYNRALSPVEIAQLFQDNNVISTNSRSYNPQAAIGGFARSYGYIY